MSKSAKSSTVRPNRRAHVSLEVPASDLLAQIAPRLQPVDSIRARPGNPRRHSQKQIRQLMASIRRHKFVNSILVDDDGVIIAGEGRWRAAQALNMKMVPTIVVRGLTPDQIKSYVIADNQTALQAEWDIEVLCNDLLELEAGGIDMAAIGFDDIDLDNLLSRREQPTSSLDQNIPEPQRDRSPISAVGDLWHLGRHSLLCADSRHPDAYKKLLENQRAQMVFTDPPYGVKINGHVSGKGAIKHREFVMGGSEMSPTAFRGFLGEVVQRLADFSVDASIHYICMDWRHTFDLLTAALPIYSEFKNLCVWNKTNGGMGSFYRSKHELILVFKKGKGPHINNFGLGQGGRHRTNVWDYAGATSLTRERLEDLALHPTVKPVAMVADAIKDCSSRGGLILDPFCGSGSTLLAAEIAGRNCAAIELDPLYVDVAIRRWQLATGEKAKHSLSGKTFDEIAKRRARGGGNHG